MNNKLTDKERRHIYNVKELPCSVCGMEEWKDVVGFEGFYLVSNLGNVKSIARENPRNKRVLGGGIVKPILGSRGYYVINLTKSTVRKQLFLHKIVLEAFIGKRPEGMQGCHNDGNKLNCKLDNLRWDTISNNHKDKRLHGTWQVGEKANNVKLNDEIVIYIRKNKLTSTQAVKMFGLSPTNAKRIIKGETWRHLNV